MSLKALSMTYSARVRNARSAIHTGATVLHVGCGDGYLDPFLCSRYALTVGVDINFPDLRSATISNGDQRVSYILIDGFVLPFESESFDEIVSIDVLEHAEDDVALVREMGRVLKQGGHLTMTVPNADYPFTFDPLNALLELLVGRHLPFGMWGFGHRRLYKVQSLRELLGDAGLAVREVTRMSFWLVGLIENAYLLNVVQPLTKSSAGNLPLGVDAQSGEVSRRLGSLEPPRLLEGIRDALMRLDRALFGRSRLSVNFMVSAEKA
jgi:2-polyprenyl-3-methyl-5-hydroxy-6-metoxy-1,4-benzoquinol methylase